jgi:hypothetical protein
MFFQKTRLVKKVLFSEVLKDMNFQVCPSKNSIEVKQLTQC